MPGSSRPPGRRITAPKRKPLARASELQKGVICREVYSGKADPWARSYNYDTNGEISLVAPNAAHLDRWPAIGDAKLAPRTLAHLARPS